MSHKLFHHSNLSNARIWDFLKQIDAAEACREAGCPRCGGVLHSASYPRKPYGLVADLRDDVRRLCCSVCRRRVKPPSVRFFGRRFYVGALFVLVSALSLAGGVRLETIARRIPSPTLRRWRRWWREEFLLTPEWAVKRGELAVPGEAPLRWLLRLIRGLQARLRFAVALLASPPPKGKLRAELERLTRVGSPVRRGACALLGLDDRALVLRGAGRTAGSGQGPASEAAGRRRPPAGDGADRGAARSIPGASVVVSPAALRQLAHTCEGEARAWADAVLRDADAGDAGSRAGTQAPAQVA